MNELQFSSAGLREALKAIGPVVNPKSPRPTLANVLLEIGSDGFASLTGANLETAIRVVLPGEVDSQGAVKILLPCERLRSLLGLTRSDNLTMLIEDDECEVEILAGKSRYTLPLEKADAFPMPVFLEGPAAWQLKASDFRTLLRRTDYACVRGTDRFDLDGSRLHLSAFDDKLRAVGTDMVVVAQQVVPAIKTGESEVPSATIPSSAIKHLMRLAENEDQVEISCTMNLVLVRFGRISMTSRLSGQRFPKSDAAFTCDPTCETFADRDDLLLLVKEACLTVPPDGGRATITIDGETLAIETRGGELGRFSGAIACRLTSGGVPYSADYDPRLLERILIPMEKGSTVNILFESTDEREPIRIFDDEAGFRGALSGIERLAIPPGPAAANAKKA
jgi:DNA polymerase-3 subunit beta